MNVFEEVRQKAVAEAENILLGPILTEKFKQYIHRDIGITHCKPCMDFNRRVFETGTEPSTPTHPNCHCVTKYLRRKSAGTISKKAMNGPDYFLKNFHRLPNYYITKAEAYKLGWKEGKNLSRYAPGKMLGGDVYNNDKQYLPVKKDRIWYECDVDYYGGKRNALRLFYSSDGLLFFSQNHLKPGEAELIFIE